MGHMASGKSIMGKMIASKLDLNHFDSDEEIVKKTNLTINQIFSQKCDEYFRDQERKILHQLTMRKNIIISFIQNVTQNYR